MSLSREQKSDRMNQTFTIDSIRNAKEVYFYNQETLYIVDDSDDAYGFYKKGSAWFYKDNFWDYFESSLMLSYFTPITKDQAVELYLDWNRID